MRSGRKKQALLVSFPRALLVVNMPHGTLLSSPLPTPSDDTFIVGTVSLPSGPVCSAGHEAIKNTVELLVSACVVQ